MEINSVGRDVDVAVIINSAEETPMIGFGMPGPLEILVIVGVLGVIVVVVAVLANVRKK